MDANNCVELTLMLILCLDESDLTFWDLLLKQFFNQFHLPLAQLVAGVRPSRRRQQQQQHERGRPHLALWVCWRGKEPKWPCVSLVCYSSAAEEKGLTWAVGTYAARLQVRTAPGRQPSV